MNVSKLDVIVLVLLAIAAAVALHNSWNDGDAPRAVYPELHPEEYAAETKSQEVASGCKSVVSQPQDPAPVLVEVSTRPDIPLTADLQISLQEACKEFSIDYYIMVALIERETQFRNVTGDGGQSVGYCQVQERWWSGIMEDIGTTDLMDPPQNFRTACAILQSLQRLYDGDITDALTAYNTGHGGESVYAREVLQAADRWRV